MTSRWPRLLLTRARPSIATPARPSIIEQRLIGVATSRRNGAPITTIAGEFFIVWTFRKIQKIFSSQRPSWASRTTEIECGNLMDGSNVSSRPATNVLSAPSVNLALRTTINDPPRFYQGPAEKSSAHDAKGNDQEVLRPHLKIETFQQQSLPSLPSRP